MSKVKSEEAQEAVPEEAHGGVPEYLRVYATVDLGAVKENMESMKRNLPAGTGIMGVVKADGYGHGAVPVAKAIAPYVEAYAAATLEEALELREHGIVKPILVLGVLHRSQYGKLAEQEIRASVFTWEQAIGLSAAAAAAGRTAYVHLALDTGMSRIGMRPDKESVRMAVKIGKLPGICVEGLFTHFARADEADKTSALGQLKAFLDFAGQLKEQGLKIKIRHISNSAGILGMREAACDMVRAGISVYGLYPSKEAEKSRVRLRPVLELKSRVTCIRTIAAGTPVSYGGTFVAKEPMTIATVSVGYGDGYPRNLSGKGRVLIHGKPAPILGRICMDQMMVDISKISGVKEWDLVTLIGKDGQEAVTVEELAETGGGFHYEILCGIGKRVPRIYISSGRAVKF